MSAIPDFTRIERAASRLDTALAERARRESVAVDGDEQPDHHRNVPRPDPACLYGLIGDIARAGGDTTEANPYAIALNALAYLGCCVGRGPYLPLGNTYHHARLFTQHVGRSAVARKGEALGLIHRIDKSLRARNVELAPQVHRGGLSSREGLAFLIHDGYREGKKEVKAIADKRLWIVESEFANVLHQTKRDGNTLSAALRDCFDGVTIKPATKSNRISATDPHISLSAAVTPTELLSLIAARELSNGFANRFLTIYSERSRLLPFPEATPQPLVDALAERIAEVLRFAGADRVVDHDRLKLSLTPTAAKLYAELYRSELNRHDFGPLVNGLLDRRAPVLLRIAMLLALTDKTLLIEEQHIRAALAWIRYWVESVRFIFSSAAQEDGHLEITNTANKIAAFLTERGRQSRTRITADCFHGKLSKDRIDAALEELLSRTPPAVVVEVEKRSEAAGSPTKFYRMARSANSANSVDSCGTARDSALPELSEPSKVRAEDEASSPTTVRSVRSARGDSNSSQSTAEFHSSLNSLSSRDEADCERL